MVKVKKTNIPRYSSEDLEEALEAIHAGIPLGIVSKQYNIPKTTLFDKKSGLSKPVICRRGPQSILGDVNERRLVEWVLYMCGQGFSVTKNDVMDSAQRLSKNMELKTVFKNGRPGRTWFENFQKRHSDLCERLSQNMLCSRAAVTKEKIRQWFSKMKSYFVSKDLLTIEARRVFSYDESGFHLCPQGQRVFAKQGDRSMNHFVKNDDKECVTALFCGNAAGELIPPMIMFNYVRIPSSVATLMPKDWGIGRSDSGRMTAASFFEWTANIFHPWLVKKKIPLPVILYVDGHSSHVTLELSDFCRENKIELIALYPNSSHILQPMNVAVFHPLKAAWKKKVPQWRLSNSGQRLKREHFAPILRSAMSDLNWKEILRSGFEATGLYPFTPDGINYEKHFKKSCNELTKTSPDLKAPSERTHLEYIEANIDSELLDNFKLVKDEDEWTGDITNKGLFLFWKKLKNKDEEPNRIHSS